MFQVKGRDLHPRTKYDMHVYTVYAVRYADSDGGNTRTLFLIWQEGAWVWETATYFEPVK